jgi:sugar/nucleoside kinase (ribokinase family)
MGKVPEVIGLGSPLVDLCIQVDDAFLAEHVPGAKGGMELVSAAEVGRVLAVHGGMPAQAPGGSACNVLAGCANLGLGAAFIGCTGDDDLGEFMRMSLAVQGVDARLIVRQQTPTGRVLAMVTPDAQRTFRTCLGAAATLSAAEVSPDSFAGARFVVMEGYSCYDHSLVRAIALAARQAGAELVLDFASHEVVRANQPVLAELMAQGLVGGAILNQDEAAAWSAGDPRAALDEIAPLVRFAAVKLGADGAWLRRGGEKLHTPGIPAKAIDTNGAGDAWLAGLLAGLVRGCPLDVCGELAARAGAAAVEVVGAQVPRPKWRDIKGRLDAWS